MTADEKTLGEQVTTWQIGESGTELVLDGDGEGEVTFTVTNASGVQDRAVLTITPLDGAADSWFTVDEPQRAVGPGASVVYAVKVKVPPDTAAGAFGMQGVAYSADTDPSESSVTSKRVGITVPPPPPKKGIPKWIFIVIAAAVLLVIALAAFFLTRGGGGLSNEEPPEIQGEPAVLAPVTASPGEWSDEVDVAFQWQRCDRDGESCEDIEGATGPVFTPGGGEINLTLRVEVIATAQDDDGDTASATSAASTAIPAPDLANAAVTDVRGLTAAAASAVLAPDFVVATEVDATQTATLCSARVVDQRPGGGTSLRRGETVTLITTPVIVNIQACAPEIAEEFQQPIRVIDDTRVSISEDLARDIVERQQP